MKVGYEICHKMHTLPYIYLSVCLLTMKIVHKSILKKIYFHQIQHVGKQYHSLYDENIPKDVIICFKMAAIKPHDYTIV